MSSIERMPSPTPVPDVPSFASPETAVISVEQESPSVTETKAESGALKNIRTEVVAAILQGNNDAVTKIIQKYISDFEPPNLAGVQSCLELLHNHISIRSNENDPTVEMVQVDCDVPVKIGFFDQVIKVSLAVHQEVPLTLSIGIVAETLAELPKTPQPIPVGPDVKYLGPPVPRKKGIGQRIKEFFSW